MNERDREQSPAPEQFDAGEKRNISWRHARLIDGTIELLRGATWAEVQQAIDDGGVELLSDDLAALSGAEYGVEGADGYPLAKIVVDAREDWHDEIWIDQRKQLD